MSLLPQSAAERKRLPLATGVLDYFPLALAEVAHLSMAGNDQHNPGSPLHWDRAKSTAHADCLMRHLAERGTFDSDGQRHSAKVAWRALALLQLEVERVVANSATSVAKSATVGVCAPSIPFDARQYMRVGEEGHHPMMAETLRTEAWCN